MIMHFAMLTLDFSKEYLNNVKKTTRIFRFQIQFKATYTVTGIIQFVFLFNFSSSFSCSEIILAYLDKVNIGVQVKGIGAGPFPSNYKHYPGPNFHE